MKVLVVNAGSSSIKYQVFDMTDEFCSCQRSGGPRSVFPAQPLNINPLARRSGNQERPA